MVLLDILSPYEVETVIAHELGHLRELHIPKYQILRGLLGLAGILVFVQFSDSLSVLVICTPALSALALPVLNAFIRNCEFEADSFVPLYSDGKVFIQALDKLHQQNSSLEATDKLYGDIYQGHPMTAIRKQKLQEVINGPIKY